jgi:hypothetical protein
MNRGQSVFAQLLGFVPFSHFEHLVDRFASNHGIKHFSAWNHFLCIAYSQLTRREGLRDLVACLNSQRSKLYHIGIRGRISRSTLADASERRDWRVFEALGHRLIAIAVELHQGEDSALGLKEPLYALDSTTIDLCLTLFPWADFRSTKAAVKAHTIVDLRGAIPVFVHITTGKVHDVNVLDLIHWPAGAIVAVDRGYLDFARLYSLHQRQVSFVIRAKDNLRYTWAASREVDKSTGLRSDHNAGNGAGNGGKRGGGKRGLETGSRLHNCILILYPVFHGPLTSSARSRRSLSRHPARLRPPGLVIYTRRPPLLPCVAPQGPVLPSCRSGALFLPRSFNHKPLGGPA